MKKFFLVIISILFCITIFADTKISGSLQTPNIIAHIAPPAKFFASASEIFKAICKNPKLELQTSLTLMPLGYPKFNGISKTENALVCVFEINSQKPIIIVAIKKEGEQEPAIINTLSSSNCKIENKNGFIFIVFNANNDVEKYLNSILFELQKNETAKIAKITLDKDAIKYLLKNEYKEIVNDAQEATIKLNKNDTRATISLEIKVSKSSPTFQKLKEIKRERLSKEAALIPQDSQLSIISKTKIPSDFFELGKSASKNIFQRDFSENHISLASRNTETFAMSVNFGNPIQATSIGVSQATFSEMQSNVKDNLKIKCGENKEITISNISTKIDGVDYIETSFSNLPKEKMYSTIVDGFSLSASNKNDFVSSIKRISNFDKNADFPLRKYASIDADLIAIFNTRAILNNLLKSTGTMLKDEVKVSDNIITVNILENKIRIFAYLDFESLRYFGECRELIGKK